MRKATNNNPKEPVKTKTCTKCGREFPATLEYFHSNSKGGLCSRCKCCRNKQSVERYAENREHESLRHKKYREEHKEAESARSKKYRKKNKKHILAYQRAHYLKNKEDILAKRRERYQKNKEAVSIQGRAYYQENRENISLRQKKYRIKNQERFSLRDKEKVENLPNYYVARYLGVGANELPQDVIETKRLIIQIRREIKNKGNQL